MKMWSIVAVLFVLAVASVSAYHMSSAGGSSDLSNDRTMVNDQWNTDDQWDTNEQRNTVSETRSFRDSERVIIADSAIMGCDANPYDSIDLCASDVSGFGDGRSTVGDTTFIDETTNVNDIVATSTTSSDWILLRCRAGDSTTVSETGQTSSTFGRTTASTASNAQSGNNAFDRQTVSDDRQRVNSNSQNDDFTGRVTTSSMWTTVTTENGDQLECYVTDDAETMTLGSAGAGDTRGFESPVVYRGTLNTARTADPNADANDVVAEGDADTGNTNTVSDSGSFNQQAD